MQRVRNVWETKQKKIQLKGMSESEMLWKSFQGNEVAMQSAIDKGHIQVQNDMYIWQREIHEHISGGTDSYSSGPQQMTQQDMQKLLELLHFAPWADWAVTPNKIPKVQLKTAATPVSDAIQKAHECLDASKAVCLSMETFYKWGPVTRHLEHARYWEHPSHHVNCNEESQSNADRAYATHCRHHLQP